MDSILIDFGTDLLAMFEKANADAESKAPTLDRDTPERNAQ